MLSTAIESDESVGGPYNDYYRKAMRRGVRMEAALTGKDRLNFCFYGFFAFLALNLSDTSFNKCVTMKRYKESLKRRC